MQHDQPVEKPISEDHVEASPPSPEAVDAENPVTVEDAHHRRVMASANRVMRKHRSAFAALAK